MLATYHKMERIYPCIYPYIYKHKDIYKDNAENNLQKKKRRKMMIKMQQEKLQDITVYTQSVQVININKSFQISMGEQIIGRLADYCQTAFEFMTDEIRLTLLAPLNKNIYEEKEE